MTKRTRRLESSSRVSSTKRSNDRDNSAIQSRGHAKKSHADVRKERMETHFPNYQEVAKDESIFRPDGLIVFPRSDGDPNHRPGSGSSGFSGENAEAASYHLCESEDDEALVRFKQKVGFLLAELFSLPKGPDWRLSKLPEHYLLTIKQRDTNPNPQKLHKDAYVFGFKKALFRSAPEYVVHLLLLLCDPSMQESNCKCKYCCGGDEWKVLIGDLSRTRHVGSASKSNVTCRLHSLHKGRRIDENSFQIRSQKAPGGHSHPGKPIVSTNERTRELSVVEQQVKGAFEGFRDGEIAFYSLAECISRPGAANPSASIHLWPVFVEQSSIRAKIEDPQVFKDIEDSTPFEGSVTQTRTYRVKFLGTEEEATVDEIRLVPALAADLPNIESWELAGDRALMSGGPENTIFNFENGKQRAGWDDAMPIFVMQLYYVNAMRSLYTLTDNFSRRHWGASPPVVDFRAHNATGEVMDHEERTTNAEHSNYMEVDEDDSNARRRLATIDPALINLSTEADSVSTNDSNVYWQGLYLGLERLWVGDLVRLSLGNAEAKRMFMVLDKSNNLYNSEDRKNPRLDCQFVLRIKAIYRPADAEPEDTDDKIRVAGDVFRIVSYDEYDRENESRLRRSEGECEGFAERHDRLTTGASSAGVETGQQKALASRPSFLIPIRPFLDPSHESHLPLSPRVPAGYGLQRINQSSAEVIFSVQQIAGRLYSSLVAGKNISPASIDRARFAQNTDDDDGPYSHEDDILSLSGVLPGYVKSMGVRTKGGQTRSRSALFEVAMHEMYKQFKEDLAKSTSSRSEQFTLNEGIATGAGRSESDATVSDEGCEVSNLGQNQRKRSSSTQDRDISPPLSHPWKKIMSRSKGIPYFANLDTKETSWVRPKGA